MIKVALNGSHRDGTQREMTRAGALLVVLALCAPAGAQPADPYGPADGSAAPSAGSAVPPAAPSMGSAAPPATQDPVLSEQIAESLVARAHPKRRPPPAG